MAWKNARDGLNRAYRVPETRSFLWRRVQAVLVVVLGAFGLIVASSVLVGMPLLFEFLQNRTDLLDDFRIRALLTLARYLAGGIVLFAILWPFHRYLPAGDRRIRRTLPGIIVTIVGIIIGSEMFALYLDYNANYTALYAGLASIMITIFYLYIVAALLIFGAELNQTLMEMEREREHANAARHHRRSRRRRSETLADTAPAR